MQVENGISNKWSGRVPPLDLSAVSVCPNETEHRWKSSIQKPTRAHYDYRTGSDGLPIDPREWTRANVWTWLLNMAMIEHIEPGPELAQKFPMNGKALCLMSIDMYLSRVPVGGKMLYRDFRVRLARAMSL